MDMHAWVASRKLLNVSNTGYFLYVDVQHKDIQGMLTDENLNMAWVKFESAITPYEADPNWVEPIG